MRGAPGDGAEFDAMSADAQTEVTEVVVNVGKALGAYQRLLSCGPSRFDRWMHGDEDALTRAEQRGQASLRQPRLQKQRGRSQLK